MNELKPCPFCGGEADFLGDTCSIKCPNCGCAFICTNPLISRLDVKEAWNRRVTMNESLLFSCCENCKYYREFRCICPGWYEIENGRCASFKESEDKNNENHI